MAGCSRAELEWAERFERDGRKFQADSKEMTVRKELWMMATVVRDLLRTHHTRRIERTHLVNDSTCGEGGSATVKSKLDRAHVFEDLVLPIKWREPGQ